MVNTHRLSEKQSELTPPNNQSGKIMNLINVVDDLSRGDSKDKELNEPKIFTTHEQPAPTMSDLLLEMQDVN